MNTKSGWIKMRGSLIRHPKVIAISRLLHEGRAFREWLTPGGAGNGQIVSNDVLRKVTLASLLGLWSAAREHGKFVGTDLVLEGITIDDLDEMGDLPGLGQAVESVGWAIVGTKPNRVTLPDFRSYNFPMDNAERQAAFRERALRSVTKSNAGDVTKALPSRVEKRIPPKSPKGDFPTPTAKPPASAPEAPPLRNPYADFGYPPPGKDAKAHGLA